MQQIIAAQGERDSLHCMRCDMAELAIELGRDQDVQLRTEFHLIGGQQRDSSKCQPSIDEKAARDRGRRVGDEFLVIRMEKVEA